MLVWLHRWEPDPIIDHRMRVPHIWLIQPLHQLEARIAKRWGLLESGEKCVPLIRYPTYRIIH
jgi:hypothetical protein